MSTSSRVPNEFGYRLRLLRVMHNKSMEQVRRKLNLGVNTLGYYERGEVEPTLSNLIKIADYFHVSLDWLVGRENYDERNNED